MKGLKIVAIDKLGLPHLYKGLNDQYLLDDFELIDVQEDESYVPLGKNKCTVKLVQKDESEFFAWSQWDYLNERFGLVYNFNIKHLLDGTGKTYKDLQDGKVHSFVVDIDVWEKCYRELTYSV